MYRFLEVLLVEVISSIKVIVLTMKYSELNRRMVDISVGNINIRILKSCKQHFAIVAFCIFPPKFTSNIIY